MATTCSTRRIYIGGLDEGVQAQDLQERFQRFGTLNNVEIVRLQDTDLCRGFAYMDMLCTPTDWNRCLSTLNGSKWKGKVLRIELAQPSYKQRLEKEQQEALVVEKPTRHKRPFGVAMHATDMNVVTERTIQGKRLWKRGKFGRALPVMRMVHGGKRIILDPVDYADNINKLQVSLGTKSVVDLCWTWNTKPRWALDAAAANEAEDESDATRSSDEDKEEEEDAMHVDVQAEASHALSILNEMMGMQPESHEATVQEQPVHAAMQWKSVIRYDPEEHSSTEESSHEEDEEEEEQPPPPQQQEERHFQVMSDLKSMFTPQAQDAEPFRLFGLDDEDEEDEEEPAHVPHSSFMQPVSTFTLPSTTLFLHFDHMLLQDQLPFVTMEALHKGECTVDKHQLLRDAKSKNKLALKKKKRQDAQQQQSQ